MDLPENIVAVVVDVGSNQGAIPIVNKQDNGYVGMVKTEESSTPLKRNDSLSTLSKKHLKLGSRHSFVTVGTVEATFGLCVKCDPRCFHN